MKTLEGILMFCFFENWVQMDLLELYCAWKSQFSNTGFSSLNVPEQFCLFLI